VEALKAALTARKSSNDDLVFRTKYGKSWHTDTKASPLSAEFRKLCKDAGVYQEARGFYALRHTFQTIGDETGDYLAVKQVMGHIDGSISATYRERFPDAQLVAIVNHVHGWLYGEKRECA
jgi:integrase